MGRHVSVQCAAEKRGGPGHVFVSYKILYVSVMHIYLFINNNMKITYENLYKCYLCMNCLFISYFIFYSILNLLIMRVILRMNN